MSSDYRGNPAAFRAPLALALLLSFPFLGGCYLMKQGTILVGHQGRAREISELLEDPRTPAELRTFLLRVEDIREYAVDSFGLKRNRNYTRYLEVDGDHLADVVSASARDRFEPYLWRFPLFGRFPYKGFFDPRDARQEAERLRRRDLDVLVREVDAFSTLGILRDPVYSFMAGYSLFELASVLIHEQVHATVFIRNQVQFNEEMATFIGREGALQYVREKAGPDSQEYREALRRLQNEETLFRLFRELYGRLEALYSGGHELEETLRRKELLIREFRAELALHFERLAERLPINNATVLSYARYSMDLSLFERLHDRLGRDLAATVAFLRSIPRDVADPKAFIRERG